MKENSNLQKNLSLLAKSSMIVLVGVILSKLFTYLYRIVLARSFDPETYGLFNLAIMIVGLLSSVAAFGMPEGVLRFISLDMKNKNLGKSKYIVKTATRTALFTSVSAGAILFFLSAFISINVFNKPGLTIYLRFFSLALPFITFGALYLAIIRSFEKIALYTGIQNILQNGIKLGALILLIFLGLNLFAIIGSYMFGVFFVAFISYLGIRKRLKKINESKEIKPKDKNKLKKSFFSYSWPVVFLGITGTLLYWIDSFVIGYYMSAVDLGFYNVAFTIAILLNIAPELFIQLFFPLVVKEYSHKRMGVVRELSKQVAKWILIINIPIFIILFFYPELIITLLFGEEYIPGAEPLKILSFGVIISSLFVVLSNSLLSMKSKTKLMLRNTLFVAILNFILNILLVPKYGLNGAAISTIISLILFSAILLAEVKWLLNVIPVRRKMLYIVIVASVLTIIFTIIKILFQENNFIGFIITLTILIVAYIPLIILFSGFDNNDKATLSLFVDKLNLKSKNFLPQEKPYYRRFTGFIEKS